MSITRVVEAADDPPSADSASRQLRDDAWWTGPLLAPSASTLPHGHFLVEPYVYDAIVYARYDTNGTKGGVTREHASGSLTYLLYGFTDRFTAGVIPRFGFRRVIDGQSSSAAGVSDLVVQGQFRLTLFEEGRRVPTMSLAIAETLPTGKYDQLGDRRSDALGSGAYTSTLSLYSQYLFWLPNGRILRTRLNLSYAMSSDVSVRDVSVYATPAGFRGHAQPGDSFVADSAWEYSVTRNWVLAVDLVYEHDANTFVQGTTLQQVDLRTNFGSSASLALAPAIEHNWSGKVGVILGARFVPAGRNTSVTVIPIAAINLVY